MPWDGRRILVTGAGGFVGSHLTEQLVVLGAQVTAFVRYNSRNDWGLLEVLPPQIKGHLHVVMGDLRDADAVKGAMKDVEVAFHLGAIIPIPYSYRHPREVVETNVMGALNVLTAARDLETGKVVHTSTSEVYGTAWYTPIDERHPLQAQSPYAASKIAADKLAESFHRSFDLPVTTLRPFNTYGPRQSARAVIPTIITQALMRDEIRLGAVDPIRDFTYVSDTVEGFLRIADCPEAVGECVNVGSGEGIVIGDLADRIVSLIGRKIPIAFDAERVRPERSEVDRLIADATKAAALMDWKPKVSLEAGLTRTIDWISNARGRYKVDTYNV